MSEEAKPGQERITRNELLWAAAVGLVTLLLVQVPYALAYLTTSTDHTFSGVLFNIEDANQYLSAIRQGTEGNWLYQVRFTPELHQAGPLYLPYTGLGQIAGGLGLSPQLVFHLASRFSAPQTIDVDTCGRIRAAQRIEHR